MALRDWLNKRRKPEQTADPRDWEWARSRLRVQLYNNARRAELPNAIDKRINNDLSLALVLDLPDYMVRLDEESMAAWQWPGTRDEWFEIAGQNLFVDKDAYETQPEDGYGLLEGDDYTAARIFHMAWQSAPRGVVFGVATPSFGAMCWVSDRAEWERVYPRMAKGNLHVFETCDVPLTPHLFWFHEGVLRYVGVERESANRVTVHIPQELDAILDE